MDENKSARQKIIIAVIGFITLVSLLSLLVVFFSRDTSVPPEKTSIGTPATRTPSNQLLIYNVGDLIALPLSTFQTAHIEGSLRDFIKTYQGEKMSYVTIDKSSLIISYNESIKTSELRFSVTSNSNTLYLVRGLFADTNDIYITVYKADNTLIYSDPIDDHEDE